MKKELNVKTWILPHSSFRSVPFEKKESFKKNRSFSILFLYRSFTVPLNAWFTDTASYYPVRLMVRKIQYIFYLSFKNSYLKNFSSIGEGFA